MSLQGVCAGRCVSYNHLQSLHCHCMNKDNSENLLLPTWPLPSSSVASQTHPLHTCCLVRAVFSINIQWMNEWVNEWSFYELYCMLKNDNTLKLDPRQWESLSTRTITGAWWLPMNQFGLASIKPCADLILSVFHSSVSERQVQIHSVDFFLIIF